VKFVQVILAAAITLTQLPAQEGLGLKDAVQTGTTRAPGY
jgi:hypothetical protein